ncbi:hypothetical protein RCL1_004908 [Eukaryota sp. TZLM3-RCL]
MLGNDSHVKSCSNRRKNLVEYLTEEAEKTKHKVETNVIVNHLDNLTSSAYPQEVSSINPRSPTLSPPFRRRNAASPPFQAIRIDDDLSFVNETPPPVSLSSGKSNKSNDLIQPKETKAFVKMYHEHADRSIFHFFVNKKVLFAVLRSLEFKDMIEAVRICTSSYRAHSVETMTNVIMPQVEMETRRSMQKLLKRVSQFHMTITSDGWSDSRSRPLINLMGVPIDGALFLDSCDVSGLVKSGQFLAQFISNWFESFEEHGFNPKHVLQIVTDGAANCISAGDIFEARYPHLTFTRCSAHMIDLILHGISKLNFITPIFDFAKRVLKLFKNHDFLKNVVETKAKLTLLHPGETRFATNFLVLN